MFSATILQKLRKSWKAVAGFPTSPFFGIANLLFTAFVAQFAILSAPSVQPFSALITLLMAPFILVFVFILVKKISDSKERYTVGTIIGSLLSLIGTIFFAIMAYAGVYRSLGLIDVDKPSTEPLTCVYFSIVTWTTLGYGDVRPSEAARLIAASEALIGYGVMAALIGIVASIVNRILADDAEKSH